VRGVFLIEKEEDAVLGENWANEVTSIKIVKHRGKRAMWPYFCVELGGRKISTELGNMRKTNIAEICSETQKLAKERKRGSYCKKKLFWGSGTLRCKKGRR